MAQINGLNGSRSVMHQTPLYAYRRDTEHERTHVPVIYRVYEVSNPSIEVEKFKVYLLNQPHTHSYAIMVRPSPSRIREFVSTIRDSELEQSPRMLERLCENKITALQREDLRRSHVLSFHDRFSLVNRKGSSSEE